MAYVKQNWENLPSTNTPITAERLNHMEDGIAEAWEHGGGSGAGETLRIGTILPFTGSTTELPTGYMLCDGTELSRTDYSDLFAIIGTSFGAGNGSSTFNLPNLKGKVLTGLDSNDEDFASIGTTGGEKSHTLTVSEMPSHQHNISPTNRLGNFSSGSGYTTGVNNTYGTDSNYPTAIAGGGQPHNILQPYVVVNYIIKVTQSAPVQAQIVGTYTESDIDGYSTEYVNGLNTYSTQEKRVGTWINGKPTYKITLDYIVQTGTNAWHNIATISNVETIVIKELFVIRQNQIYLNLYNNYNFYFEDNTLKEQHSSNYYEGYHLYITVEYTKTTD